MLHKTTYRISLLLAGCFALSCCHKPCSNLPISAVSKITPGGGGKVIEATPIEMSLNPAETAAVFYVTTIWTRLLLNLVPVGNDPLSRDGIALAAGGLTSVLSRQSGQIIRVRTRRGDILELVQPIYCETGPIHVGQRVLRVDLYDRSVFLPHGVRRAVPHRAAQKVSKASPASRARP